jgi:glycosyltransferase involved in cell wall biosynthesis
MTQRARVLHIIPTSGLGGAERSCVTLVAGLDAGRFEPSIACHDGGPLVEEYRRHCGAVVVLDLLNVFNVGTVRRLARLMRRLRVDVVHTHTWRADVLGGLAATLARVPVRVSSVRADYFAPADEGRGGRAVRAALRGAYPLTYRLFDRLIAVSDYLAGRLAHRRGLAVSAAKIVTVHNGIAPVELPLPPAPSRRQTLGLPATGRLVTAVANFFAIKGHRWLLDAFPAILARVPDARLVLVGDGPTLPAMREHAATRGLGSSVLFLGARRDALGLMAASDVVVLPSLMEGCPLAAMEAQALGRPVVATRVGGTPEVVAHDQSGFLVPPRDAPALTDAIVAVLADPALAASFGAQGQELIRSCFSADKMVKEVARQYDELLDGRRNGR